METGNRGVEKNGKKSQGLCFSKAATSGNLCEASLPPLFSVKGTRLFSLISFQLFNLCAKFYWSRNLALKNG